MKRKIPPLDSMLSTFTMDQDISCGTSNNICNENPLKLTMRHPPRPPPLSNRHSPMHDPSSGFKNSQSSAPESLLWRQTDRKPLYLSVFIIPGGNSVLRNDLRLPCSYNLVNKFATQGTQVMKLFRIRVAGLSRGETADAHAWRGSWEDFCGVCGNFANDSELMKHQRIMPSLFRQRLLRF